MNHHKTDVIKIDFDALDDIIKKNQERHVLWYEDMSPDQILFLTNYYYFLNSEQRMEQVKIAFPGRTESSIRHAMEYLREKGIEIKKPLRRGKRK